MHRESIFVPAWEKVENLAIEEVVTIFGHT